MGTCLILIGSETETSQLFHPVLLGFWDELRSGNAEGVMAINLDCHFSNLIV